MTERDLLILNAVLTGWLVLGVTIGLLMPDKPKEPTAPKAISDERRTPQVLLVGSPPPNQKPATIDDDAPPRRAPTELGSGWYGGYAVTVQRVALDLIESARIHRLYNGGRHSDDSRSDAPETDRQAAQLMRLAHLLRAAEELGNPSGDESGGLALVKWMDRRAAMQEWRDYHTRRDAVLTALALGPRETPEALESFVLSSRSGPA